VYEVPRRIDVVIIVAGVGERLAHLTRKTGHQRRDEKATHLFLLFKGAFALRRPNERW
jgi:hypothetical protein